MIDNTLASRLIEKVSPLTDYNINIMDNNGILIACSRTKERIGSFHEVAYQIIKSDNDTVIVDQDTPDPGFGVKEGVNMAIYLNKRKAGVVGVTGNPDAVMPFAKMIKLSVEVMLEYEMYKYESTKKYNISEQMLQQIFYNDQLRREDMLKYVELLQLNENLVRIPVLIDIKNTEINTENIMELIRTGENYTKQDVIGITREGFIFVLKAMKGTIEHLMQDYKYIIGDYLSPFLRHARNCNLNSSIYVGPMQNDVMYYRQAYLYCIWMQKNIGKEGSFYFYDYLVRYFQSMVSLPEFHGAFYVLKQELGKRFIENYKETVGVLIDTDYNLQRASELMHVHKNTLVYRLDKIREALNINPLIHNTDREFMDSFYFYLNTK